MFVGWNRALLGVMALGLAVSAGMAAPKKKPAAKKKPPVAAKPDAKAGMMAFKSEGCTGCHKTKDFADGGEIGPDLSAVAGHEDAAKISAYIKKPKAGSVMPAFKGPAPTLANLTAYMMTQK